MPSDEQPPATPGEPVAEIVPIAVRRSRAGRDLPAAIVVGLVLSGIIAAMLFLYRASFVALVTIAVVVAIVELCAAMSTAGIHPPRAPLIAGAIATDVGTWFMGRDALAAGILLTSAVVCIWRTADGPKGFVTDVGAGLFVSLYVPFLAGFAILLTVPEDGARRVIVFIATVVCSDIGGYAVGVAIGRHPMAPSISPSKSWEGLAGSLGGCVLAGILLLTLVFHTAWWMGLIVGLGIAIAAVCGDLVESLIKRDIDVKDMGHLLPGHGGMMDRLDSLLPAAAVGYLLLSWFVPTP